MCCDPGLVIRREKGSEMINESGRKFEMNGKVLDTGFVKEVKALMGRVFEIENLKLAMGNLKWR